MTYMIKNNNGGSTSKAIEFFKKYKNAFGDIVFAEMKSNPNQVIYNLTLVNSEGEEMNIGEDCSAGFMGTGPYGTYEILKISGFDITKEFIESNSSFKLTK
ncbi:MAG: hypothetical protein GX053_01375 [Tissierella sp.]|nr:hypothetical protein [Tissierella sp.]